MNASQSSKRVTLKDVAEDAGVSRATASLVVRNSPLVAETTRAKVLASIDKLGYVYNRAAAMLRTQKSQTVGLVVTDIANPFFAQMTQGSEATLDEASYALLLANTSDDPQRQRRLLRTMYARGVDGILICPARGTALNEVKRLQQWGVPFVQVTRYLNDLDADYVGSDNVKGAEMAVRHLIAMGHRRIAFIGGSPESSARRDRLKGYRHALEHAGLELDPRLLQTSPVTRAGGYQGAVSLLDRPEPPTAALCYNDVVAFGVMLGLHAQGKTPGKDFAVVGFDDIEEAALWRPALTTVSIPPRNVGKVAADLLLARIDDPEVPAQRHIMDPKLIVRDSCCKRNG